MSLKGVQENLSQLQNRFVYVIIAVCIFFLGVTVRLYYLQILKGDEYRSFSEENTLKEIRIPAVRGLIKDRYGDTIASSRSSFDLALIPQYVRNLNAVSESIQGLVDIPAEQIKQVWPKTARMPPFYPFVITRDIGFDAMARIEVYRAIEDSPTEGYDLQGVEILPYPVRRYPGGSVAANILGYVRESSRKELTRLQQAVPGFYHLGDRVGAFGLEQRWEVLLKGTDGYQQKFVNAVGKEVQSEGIGLKLSRQPASPGLNLITTLDHKLQRFAEGLFGDKRGALAAVNPNTGEIYALVSLPTFDLSRLAGQIDEEAWKELTHDPGKVFLNRAVQSAYPPGSTYKIVTAAAALEEGVVELDEKIRCPGYLRFGRRAFKCWKSGGHGMVDVHKAIVQSCDVFFYTMGIRLGVDLMAKYAHMFGLGKKTGIEIASESPGLIPTKAWKKRARGDQWHPGENLSISIGQGYDLVTPLQNALMVSVVANGGYRVLPKLSKSFEDSDGQRFRPPGRILTDNSVWAGISKETLEVLRRALRGVVNEVGGTARRLSQLPYEISGKTGTAQVVGYGSGLHGPQYRDHALFVSYAPYNAPEIAVSVIVEHGGHGSSAAAPIAGKVIEKYMQLKAARKLKGNEEVAKKGVVNAR